MDTRFVFDVSTFIFKTLGVQTCFTCGSRPGPNLVYTCINFFNISKFNIKFAEGCIMTKHKALDLVYGLVEGPGTSVPVLISSVVLVQYSSSRGPLGCIVGFVVEAEASEVGSLTPCLSTKLHSEITQFIDLNMIFLFFLNHKLVYYLYMCFQFVDSQTS